MKALQCELCGSNELLKQDGVFVCQYCGTKYTLEEARKMMIEGTVAVTGTVKIDSSGNYANLLTLAREAFADMRFESAYSLCTDALTMNPDNAELIAMHGLSVLGKEDFAINIPSSSVNSLNRFFSMIESTQDSTDKIVSLLNNVEDYLVAACDFRINDYTLKERDLHTHKAPMDISVEEAESNLRWSKAFVSIAGSDAAHAQLAAAKSNELHNKRIDRELETLRKKSEKVRSFKQTSQKRISEIRKTVYWSAHADERDAISNEITELKNKVANLESQKEIVPGVQEIKDIDIKIKSSNERYFKLNPFKIREKRAIEKEIETLRNQRSNFVKISDEHLEELGKKISPLRARMHQLEKELSADPRYR